jgi:tRNA pseudouridine55 synthase
LGKTTPSYDLETEYDQSYSVANISLDQIETVRQSFMGEQDQLPPLFSAKKIDGKRAYDYVREGKTVILNPNKIIITSFAIQTQNFPEIHFKISCSKGTYIRSIAHDFGKKLGIGATLTNLRRIKSGDFLIEEAMSVEEWVAKITLGE